ncbi:hypothetical protein LguiB_004737 [Lonicera macranthoides]
MASLYLLIAGLLIVSAGGEMVMEQDELLGLFEVIGSLLGDPTWAQMHPQPCTETPWPGVQCEVSSDQDPQIFHITKIHIGPDILVPPCKNSAKLSNFLLNLPYLKTLSLFNCFTNSPVFLSPSLFGPFSSLETLVLDSNPSLFGEIPTSLGQVPNLRVLCLKQNNLEGNIPNEINGLVNLEQIDLSYNNLTGSIPKEIGGMKKLTILDLSWNGLQGQLPFSLGHLHFLEKIDLSSNKLQGSLPQDLGHLEKLVLLDLSHNSLSGPIPETLSGLQQLEYLVIDDNPIDTGVPIFIGSLKKLKVFSCSGCGLVGPILTILSNLKNLSALSLDNNGLKGTIPSNLGTLPNLDQLNLSKNQLSGEVLLPKEFINRLGKRLDLKGNSGLFMKKQRLHKYKTGSSFTKTPCLGTRIPRVNDGECGKKKPTWYQGNISSSSTHGLDRNFREGNGQEVGLGDVLNWFSIWAKCLNASVGPNVCSLAQSDSLSMRDAAREDRAFPFDCLPAPTILVEFRDETKD